MYRSVLLVQWQCVRPASSGQQGPAAGPAAPRWVLVVLFSGPFLWGAFGRAMIKDLQLGPHSTQAGLPVRAYIAGVSVMTAC